MLFICVSFQFFITRCSACGGVQFGTQKDPSETTVCIYTQTTRCLTPKDTKYVILSLFTLCFGQITLRIIELYDRD
jgi:hypothetical protein